MLDYLRSRTMADPNSGCWLWEGAIGKDGYGIVVIEGAPYRVHRLTFELSSGRPLGKKMACHKCDVRACVNPDHIYAGDAKTTARDMVERGRIGDRSGAHNPRAKLSAAQISEIRAFMAAGARPGQARRTRGSVSALAKRYGVARTVIHRIHTREIWANA